MSQEKMIIVTACLATLVSLVQGQVVAANCTSNTTQGMTTACSQTINNCQTGLAGVSGSGSGTAGLLGIVIKLSIGGLLKGLVAALSPLLASVGALVISLLELVLALLVAVVNLVIQLLSGLLGVKEYQTKVQEWKTSSCSQVTSYSDTGLSGVLGLVLKLVANLLKLVINIKL